MLVTEITENNCGNNSVKMIRCEITESDVDGGNRVCSLKCKCAESAESCDIYIYPNMKLASVQICEIYVRN